MRRGQSSRSYSAKSWSLAWQPPIQAMEHRCAPARSARVECASPMSAVGRGRSGGVEEFLQCAVVCPERALEATDDQCREVPLLTTLDHGDVRLCHHGLGREVTLTPSLVFSQFLDPLAQRWHAPGTLPDLRAIYHEWAASAARSTSEVAPVSLRRSDTATTCRSPRTGTSCRAGGCGRRSDGGSGCRAR